MNTKKFPTLQFLFETFNIVKLYVFLISVERAVVVLHAFVFMAGAIMLLIGILVVSISNLLARFEGG